MITLWRLVFLKFLLFVFFPPGINLNILSPILMSQSRTKEMEKKEKAKKKMEETSLGINLLIFTLFL